MATLRIDVVPGDNLQQYRFQLGQDRNNLTMTNNSCTVEVDGTCGDGSELNLYYAVFGPAGATLGLKIFCDGQLKVDITLKVRGSGPVYSSDVEFEL